MILSCILGLTVSHSTFVCTRVNDPIMTSTAGNLKNVIMTIAGAFAFGDFRFSVWNSLGLGLSMIGAIWYAAKSAMKVGNLSEVNTLYLAYLGATCVAWHVWTSLLDAASPCMLAHIVNPLSQELCAYTVVVVIGQDPANRHVCCALP